MGFQTSTDSSRESPAIVPLRTFFEPRKIRVRSAGAGAATAPKSPHGAHGFAGFEAIGMGGRLTTGAGVEKSRGALAGTGAVFVVGRRTLGFGAAGAPVAEGAAGPPAVWTGGGVAWPGAEPWAASPARAA